MMPVMRQPASEAFPFALPTLCWVFVLSALQKMVCHGEHTYLFAQSMMSILAQEEQGGSAVRRIGQEVQKSAHERYCWLLNLTDCSFPSTLIVWV